MFPFSVLMSVYKNDNADAFDLAMQSVIEQTYMPDEIILVVDGPITKELDKVIEKYRKKTNLKVLYQKENKGLGIALQIGVLNSKNELIARMDSDDISLPDRFEKQINCFANNPQLSIVGGSIKEFIASVENVVGQRICPYNDKEIKRYMKRRCGFNHMTVMFKRSDVLKSGNYIDLHYNEDYYLWIRMLQNNCIFKNLPDTLVNVRVGKDMYRRRGGNKYFNSEKFLQKYMLQNKIISYNDYLINIIIRYTVQILIPNWLRGFIFQKFFRKS